MTIAERVAAALKIALSEPSRYARHKSAAGQQESNIATDEPDRYEFVESDHPRDSNGRFTDAEHSIASQNLHDWIRTAPNDISKVTSDAIASGNIPRTVLPLYAKTQKTLSNRGETEREIVRGIAMKSADAVKMIQHGINLGGAASWTGHEGAANDFIELNMGVGKVPVIFAATVPSQYIIAASDISDEFEDAAEIHGHTFDEDETIAALPDMQIDDIEIDGESWVQMDDDDKKKAIQKIQKGDYSNGIRVTLTPIRRA